MTMFMGLTGYLLVWDQKAYWATVVAINITASAPIIGPYIADILRAGPEFGPDTLSRFYSIHMLVIPVGIATFIGLHLYFITKLGIAEPPYSQAPPWPWSGPRRRRGARPSGSACPTGGVRCPRPSRARRADAQMKAEERS